VTLDSSANVEMASVLGPRSRLFHAGPRLSVTEMKSQQRSKIRALGDALATAGIFNLDQQANALGLSRSTTWTILKGQHKASGLSPKIINRMLAAPDLPSPVRTKILEYVAEKTAGCFGDCKAKVRKFRARLGLDLLRRVS
jgi:predicted DNA-binding transcriptional regulator AlpA